MKPRIISHSSSGSYGLTAQQAGGILLEVDVAELWQLEGWHCQQQTTSASQHNDCWLENGRHWTGTATITAAGSLEASEVSAEWLEGVAGSAMAEAARDVLITEMADLEKRLWCGTRD